MSTPIPQGRLVIFSGPSGAGKDTVLNAWRELNPRVQRVVAYTTRTPREGERDGFDYHFATRDRFFEMAAAGDFLEHKEVHGNGYATPKRDMDRMLEEGLIAVLKIDVQGALEVMRLRPDALSIFLLPPNMETLERRIRGRATDSEETIQRRLANAKQEMECAHLYDRRVVNDDVKRAASEIEGVVLARA